MPDDFDASTLTEGTVAVGGSATGNIDTIGDQDWFAVSLIEGQSYEISVDGLYADDLNSLPDPFLRGLYDSAGLLIVGAESDDADIETRSGSTTFTATSSGTFFISASAYNVGTGAYSVSVTDLGPFDDFSSDVTTTGMVLPDGFALGEFEFQGDTDWFEIELVSGVRYLFELYGSGTGTWADAPDLILNPLRDANGDVITNSGEGGGENPGFESDPVESFFEYVPTYTGTHYVDASTHLLFTGRYQLNVTDLGYFDDFSDDSLTTGFLPLNGSIMGMIEADMDLDWFAVSLVAGETYDINVLGAETFDGTLDFPLLHYIVDPFGEYIPYSFNAEGSGDNATLSYLATTTGTHHIEVAAYDGHTGSYTLTIDEALLFDDWGNNPSSDGALPINSAVGGDINYLGDEDFFRVALTAGTVYQFDLNAFGFVNPLINGIYSYAWDFYYDHPDNLIPDTVNNDFGGGLDSRVIFTAPTTGDYFVSAAAAGGALGGYSLSLLEIDFATDDFAGDPSTEGTLALGGSVVGINETEDDEDWFAITLDAAHTYRFSFMGEDSYLSDFAMPSLRVLDNLGNEAFSAISETSSYNSAELTFAPIASGTYFIAVGDDLASNGTGSYTLNAEDLGPFDDFAADVSTTGAFFVDGMATTYAMGTLETSGDEDWFAISLTAGNTYEINLKGAETGVGTLDDPFFVGIYNAAGTFIDPLGNMLGFSDDDSGEGLNSFTRFIPTYTGTHFFAVAGPDDEGDPTGTYVLQVDDLGVDALISEEINEGETIDFALEYEDIGFDRALVVTSSVLSVSFSGAAVFDSGMASDPDFSLIGNTTDRFLNLEFTALDDDLVEDDEDVRITTNGFVDWVRPTADGSGAVFTNIDGGSVTGVLERATIAENIYLNINSAPEGVPTDITGFSFDQPGIIGNVLTNFTDGSGELFTVVPTSFSGTVTGDITANGDIFLSESIAAPGAIVGLNFTVIDTRGALTQSSQRITFSEEMDDFLPGNAATEFGSLIINTPSLGSIEQLSDRDRFVVDLTAGHSYVINLVSSDLSGPALTDPEIYGLFDPLGALVPGTTDNDSGIGFHAFVNRFSVDTSGEYAIEAGAFQDGSTGDYSLSISTIDDFLPSTGADVAATLLGSLAVDGIAGGHIDFAGDLDRFQMSLVAGDFYSLMVTSDTGVGDAELVGVFDSLGQFVTGTADTDDDPIPDGTVPLFSVPTTGLYDLEIGSLVPEGGAYTVELMRLGTEDDFLPGSFADVFGSIALGQAQTGTLEYSDDLDRFTATLEAGRLYTLSLEGADTQGGTLIDPTILGVYDSLDQLQPGSGDSDSGVGLNALLSGFTVAADGNYQIEVGAEEGLTGTYTLSLTSDGLVDDFLPGDAATIFGSIAVDSTETGSIETEGDRDRFQVFFEADQVYSIALTGSESLSGTLLDPELFGIFDNQNALLAGTTDNDSGPGLDASVEVIIETSGLYEIEVGSHTPSGIGGYGLTVDLLGSVDDFLPGDFATTLGSVLVDVPTFGNIETEGDRDRFEVTLQAGIVYDISLEGLPTGGGSLVNPEIIGLFDSSGALVAGTSDGDSGVGANALVSGLTVAADGTYQIEIASAADLGIGDYTLSVDFQRYLDDFLPGVAAGLGQLTLGAPSTGEVEAPGDTDRFTVTLNAGTTYQINLLGADTGSGTLTDPFLVGAFSPGSSTPFSQTSDDDSGVGVNSLSNFTPPTTGDYEIEVSGFGDATGTYTVTIDDLGLLDDFSADPSTAGQIAIGGSANGRIDFPDDADWFRAELAADRLYRIELVSADGSGALSDPAFLGVHDSNGLLLPGTENDDGGDGSNSEILFSTNQGGTHYLSAGGFLEDVGDYQLVLTDLGGVVDDDDFDIELRYEGPEIYRQAFETAENRWENVIIADLPFASVEGFGFVDDILIEVVIVDFDLVFPNVEQTIIAVSGVLDQRPNDIGNGASLPTHARIVVNSDEADRVINNLDDLAANAIGRALGFGALWEEFGLVQGSGSEAIYTGSNALREFSTLYGSANGNVLLEDGADGALPLQYWREALLINELMTPRIQFRPTDTPARPPGVIDNPLSTVTLGAMEDLGYQVNYNAADPYSLPNFASVQSAPAAATPLPQPTLASAQFAAALSADYDTVPEGEQYFYVRPNTLSESPTTFALNNANTQLISADGTSALFLEGVTGDYLLIDLSGGFEKTQPTSVSELSGTVTGAEVYSQSGTLLLRFDFSQKPVAIGELLAQWPGYAFDDENVVVVDALPGTIARINPNGGSSEMSQIVVGGSDDFVKGGDTAEMIDGGAANDTLLGEAGHDSLIGGPGDDILDGGAGTDMAVYSGAHTGYTLTLSSTETTLEDRRADGDGFDYLVDMELIDFATDVFSGPFNLQQFGGPTGLSAEEFQSFIELYIAYFNRAPDAVGLNFWGTAFANGLTLEEMAALFGPQPETLATYPEGTSNNDFATSVYNNVLGRTPDQSGIDFWVGLLDAGSVMRDQFILQVLQGAKSDLKPENGQDFVNQQIADRAYLETKTDIGAYFAVHKGMSDTDNAASVMALFTGTQDSIDAAVAAIDAFHQSALDAATGEFLMPVAGVLDDPFAIA
ncbi:MAG: DUF4214 domain-containing protein [Sulfitobacter sp.]|nr:DUF4214 domain-containing protein [Sulfitobacter sp.]